MEGHPLSPYGRTLPHVFRLWPGRPQTEQRDDRAARRSDCAGDLTLAFKSRSLSKSRSAPQRRQTPREVSVLGDGDSINQWWGQPAVSATSIHLAGAVVMRAAVRPVPGARVLGVGRARLAPAALQTPELGPRREHVTGVE